MFSKIQILASRGIALLVVVTTHFVLYHLVHWTMATRMGPLACRVPFLYVVLALGLVDVVFVVAICGGWLDTKLAKMSKLLGSSAPRRARR